MPLRLVERCQWRIQFCFIDPGSPYAESLRLLVEHGRRGDENEARAVHIEKGLGGLAYVFFMDPHVPSFKMMLLLFKATEVTNQVDDR